MTTRLPSLAGASVLVTGDVMLDRYWFGDADRISPEAPVPVVRVVRTEERPGGAANVARNVAAIGAPATLLSVIGADEPGRSLRALVDACGINAHLHEDKTLATTVKLRLIARQQQLVRIDFENAPSRDVLADKLALFRTLLGGTRAVVLSDYGKGGLAHIEQMITAARAAGIPVLVDPKGDEYTRYRGATILTPNRAELREVVGRWTSEADLARRVERLRADLGLEALLLTRSEEGMTLFEAGGVTHEPTQAREVYDVSGAGDTVIATLAAMIAAGAPFLDAMRVANHAAGIVVGKLGTAVVHPDELAAELAARR